MRYIIHAVEDVTDVVRLEKRQAKKDRIAEDDLKEEHRRLVEAVTALGPPAISNGRKGGR